MWRLVLVQYDPGVSIGVSIAAIGDTVTLPYSYCSTYLYSTSILLASGDDEYSYHQSHTVLATVDCRGH